MEEESKHETPTNQKADTIQKINPKDFVKDDPAEELFPEFDELNYKKNKRVVNLKDLNKKQIV